MIKNKDLYTSNTNYKHMEIKYNKSSIEFEKELNDLDEFVIDFIEILNELNINYVIVSGYVSILFGRSRSSEDVDMFIEKIDLNTFKILWEKLYNGFECVNTENPVSAYHEYLNVNERIRFSRKNKFVPNMEIKFPKLTIDEWALKNRKEVILNGKTLYISPIELQIAYKLSLGSEKDIEDARHLYKLFKDKLDNIILEGFNERFKTKEVFNKFLK